MRLLNTFLVIITGVTASAALVLDMHVTIEEPKDRKQAVAHEPIPVHPADVDGVIDCGSRAVVLGYRFPPCTSLPCDVQNGTKTTLEIDFSPSSDFHDPTFTIHSIVQGVETIVVSEQYLSSGNAGMSYTTSIEFTINEDPGLVTIRASVVAEELMVCGLLTVNIYNTTLSALDPAAASKLVMQGAEL